MLRRAFLFTAASRYACSQTGQWSLSIDPVTDRRFRKGNIIGLDTSLVSRLCAEVEGDSKVALSPGGIYFRINGESADPDVQEQDRTLFIEVKADRGILIKGDNEVEVGFKDSSKRRWTLRHTSGRTITESAPSKSGAIFSIQLVRPVEGEIMIPRGQKKVAVEVMGRLSPSNATIRELRVNGENQYGITDSGFDFHAVVPQTAKHLSVEVETADHGYGAVLIPILDSNA